MSSSSKGRKVTVDVKSQNKHDRCSVFDRLGNATREKTKKWRDSSDTKQKHPKKHPNASKPSADPCEPPKKLRTSAKNETRGISKKSKELESERPKLEHRKEEKEHSAKTQKRSDGHRASGHSKNKLEDREQTHRMHKMENLIIEKRVSLSASSRDRSRSTSSTSLRTKKKAKKHSTKKSSPRGSTESYHKYQSQSPEPRIIEKVKERGRSREPKKKQEKESQRANKSYSHETEVQHYSTKSEQTSSKYPSGSKTKKFMKHSKSERGTKEYPLSPAKKSAKTKRAKDQSREWDSSLEPAPSYTFQDASDDHYVNREIHHKKKDLKRHVEQHSDKEFISDEEVVKVKRKKYNDPSPSSGHTRQKRQAKGQIPAEDSKGGKTHHHNLKKQAPKSEGKKKKASDSAAIKRQLKEESSREPYSSGVSSVSKDSTLEYSEVSQQSEDFERHQYSNSPSDMRETKKGKLKKKKKREAQASPKFRDEEEVQILKPSKKKRKRRRDDSLSLSDPGSEETIRKEYKSHDSGKMKKKDSKMHSSRDDSRHIIHAQVRHHEDQGRQSYEEEESLERISRKRPQHILGRKSDMKVKEKEVVVGNRKSIASRSIEVPSKHRMPEQRESRYSPDRRDSHKTKNDSRTHSATRDPRNRSPIRESGSQSPVRESRNRSPIRDSRNRSPMRDSRNQSLIRGSRNHSPVRDSRNHSPMRDLRNRSPVRDSRNRSPIRESRNHSPGRDSSRKVSDWQISRIASGGRREPSVRILPLPPPPFPDRRRIDSHASKFIPQRKMMESNYLFPPHPPPPLPAELLRGDNRERWERKNESRASHPISKYSSERSAPTRSISSPNRVSRVPYREKKKYPETRDSKFDTKKYVEPEHLDSRTRRESEDRKYSIAREASRERRMRSETNDSRSRSPARHGQREQKTRASHNEDINQKLKSLSRHSGPFDERHDFKQCEKANFPDKRAKLIGRTSTGFPSSGNQTRRSHEHQVKDGVGHMKEKNFREKPHVSPRGHGVEKPPKLDDIYRGRQVRRSLSKRRTNSAETASRRSGSSHSSHSFDRRRRVLSPRNSLLSKNKDRDSSRDGRKSGVVKGKDDKKLVKPDREKRRPDEISDNELNQLMKTEDRTPTRVSEPKDLLEVDWNILPKSTEETRSEDVKQHSSVLAKFSPCNILMKTRICTDLLSPQMLQKLDNMYQDPSEGAAFTNEENSNPLKVTLRQGLHSYSDERLRKTLLGYNTRFRHRLFPPLIINAKTYSASIKNYMSLTKLTVEAI